MATWAPIVGKMKQDQPRPNSSTSVAANQRVHSRLASVYNEAEPHFRPENRAKVRKRLEGLAAMAPTTERLLDVGCGTGFLLSLVHDLFTNVDGVDATPAMLERVDLTPGNITVREGLAEHLPFDDGIMDMVTAYSFLDHLADHQPVLSEMRRVLRPGGLVYVDLIPNRLFWDAIYAASNAPRRPFDGIVEREINELVNHEEKLQQEFGIDPQDWRDAEPAKSGAKGFEPENLLADFACAGFSASVHFEWFLGQAKVHHGTSLEAATLIDDHLRSLLPVSAPLFKYLYVVGTAND